MLKRPRHPFGQLQRANADVAARRSRCRAAAAGASVGIRRTARVERSDARDAGRAMIALLSGKTAADGGHDHVDIVRREFGICSPVHIGRYTSQNFGCIVRPMPNLSPCPLPGARVALLVGFTTSRSGTRSISSVDVDCRASHTYRPWSSTADRNVRGHRCFEVTHTVPPLFVAGGGMTLPISIPRGFYRLAEPNDRRCGRRRGLSHRARSRPAAYSSRTRYGYFLTIEKVKPWRPLSGWMPRSRCWLAKGELPLLVSA